MVEFAVILPVFIALVAGILGLGMAIHTQLEISTAAQEGARAAYLNRSLSQVESAVLNAVDLNPALTAGDVAEATCTTSTSGTEVEVIVSRPTSFNWVLGSTSITLTGRGAVQCP